MTENEFWAGLRGFAEKFNTEILGSVEERSLELRVAGFCPQVTKLLDWSVDDSGTVQSFVYSCCVGRVTGSKGFRELLIDNNSGVNLSPFYASVLDLDGRWFVNLETRQILLPETTAAMLHEMLTFLVVHPIFRVLAFSDDPHSQTKGVEFLALVSISHQPARKAAHRAISGLSRNT